jgi:hypothetical protein
MHIVLGGQEEKHMLEFINHPKFQGVEVFKNEIIKLWVPISLIRCKIEL